MIIGHTIVIVSNFVYLTISEKEVLVRAIGHPFLLKMYFF